jgi:hypothetical protein
MDGAPTVRGLLAPGHDPTGTSMYAGQGPSDLPGHRLPKPGMPHKDDLDYLKTAIELGLLLLALPWLVRNVLHSPTRTSKRAADTHLK